MGLFKRKPSPPFEPMALLVETSQGEHYDEPSEDLLFMLMEDLQRDQDYFIVESASDTTGQTYMQVMRVSDSFLVERRQGSENTHEHATSGDLRNVHQDLTTWAFSVTSSCLGGRAIPLGRSTTEAKGGRYWPSARFIAFASVRRIHRNPRRAPRMDTTSRNDMCAT